MDEQLKIDLKPCPFCGKSVMVLNEPTDSCGLYVVVCNVNDGGCGASTGYNPTKTEAMRAWNRRAE